MHDGVDVRCADDGRAGRHPGRFAAAARRQSTGADGATVARTFLPSGQVGASATDPGSGPHTRCIQPLGQEQARASLAAQMDAMQPEIVRMQAQARQHGVPPQSGAMASQGVTRLTRIGDSCAIVRK